jgi:hypothetical protein
MASNHQLETETKYKPLLHSDNDAYQSVTESNTSESSKAKGDYLNDKIDNSTESYQTNGSV